MFSSNSNEWATPQDFYDRLNKFCNFTLDPCSDGINNKCDKYFTINDDGLKQDWSNEIVFVNPPYGREIKLWVKKCYDESLKGFKIVLLIPARTDTSYQHDYVYKSDYICFLRGRLKFGDSKNSAPFPSQLVFFNINIDEEFKKHLNKIGKLIKL